MNLVNCLLWLSVVSLDIFRFSSFVSILFIASCCIFYGGRFIKLYLANKKEEYEEKNSLVKLVKESNEENENFKSVNGENYFTGKKCVLTGTLASMGRSEAKKLIEESGGSLSESVSKKTDCLILGSEPGSKYDKAKALGIYIMEEAEFLEKIK